MLKMKFSVQHLANITRTGCIKKKHSLTLTQLLTQVDLYLKIGFKLFSFLGVAADGYINLFGVDLLMLCDRRDG